MFDREILMDSLQKIRKAIETIVERAAVVSDPNELLTSPGGMMRLDAISIVSFNYFFSLLFFSFNSFLYLCSAKPKTLSIMETIGNIKIRSREEIIAWLNRGKEIKERRMHEARQKWEERQQSKKVAAQSGFYDLEWI